MVYLKQVGSGTGTCWGHAMEPVERMRILVIDDDHDMALMIKRLLEGTLGAQVEIAGECTAAREKTVTGTFDVITLDYRLPDGDSLELLKEIMAVDNPPEVVMITGHGDEQIAVESFKLGVSGYVMKDKRMVTLLPGAVEKALSEFRRREAEKALKESGATYRAIFDAANDAIFVHDMETGDIFDVNRKMCEMYGYTREEALELNVETISSGEPPYTQEDALRWIRKAVEGEPQLFEWRGKNKEGHLFWVEVNLKRATIAGEDRLLAIVRNIDERKLSEERVRFLSSVVEQSSEGMVISDLEGNLLFVNAAWARMHGYDSTEELTGKHLNIFHNQEQVEKDVIPFNNTVMDRGYCMGEVGHMRRDSTTFPALMTSTLIRDSDGNPVIMSGICKDITERKRAEEDLKELGHFLDSIFEQSPFSMWVSNSEGTLVKENKACRDLFGIRDDKRLVGVYNIFEDNVLREQGLLPQIKAVFDRGETAHFSLEYDVAKVEHIIEYIDHERATPRILDVTISPVMDVHGTVTNAVIYHKDITER